MMTTDLIELAERCERADATLQAKLLDEAYDLLPYAHKGGNNLARFQRMLDAEAYENAAMTLIPQGEREWSIDRSYRDPRFPIYQARICILEWKDDPEETGPQGIANGNTPALALCAAALRAHAGERP